MVLQLTVVVVFLYWCGGDIPKGTLNAILKQAGLK